MALAGGMSGHLQGDGIEALFIALSVALKKSLYLLSRCHEFI